MHRTCFSAWSSRIRRILGAGLVLSAIVAHGQGTFNGSEISPEGGRLLKWRYATNTAVLLNGDVAAITCPTALWESLGGVMALKTDGTVKVWAYGPYYFDLTNVPPDLT